MQRVLVKGRHLDSKRYNEAIIDGRWASHMMCMMMYDVQCIHTRKKTGGFHRQAEVRRCLDPSTDVTFHVMKMEGTATHVHQSGELRVKKVYFNVFLKF